MLISDACPTTYERGRGEERGAWSPVCGPRGSRGHSGTGVTLCMWRLSQSTEKRAQNIKLINIQSTSSITKKVDQHSNTYQSYHNPHGYHCGQHVYSHSPNQDEHHSRIPETSPTSGDLHFCSGENDTVQVYKKAIAGLMSDIVSLLR